MTRWSPQLEDCHLFSTVRFVTPIVRSWSYLGAQLGLHNRQKMTENASVLSSHANEHIGSILLTEQDDNLL